MPLNVARFLSLLFLALTLAPSGAHLLALPNKIDLPREEYLTVQQIYQGWALLGIVVAGALVSTLLLAILSRHWRPQFILATGAFLCVLATQGIFWAFTFPANQVTRNWTVLPQVWEPLRAQWEYSHAAGAILNLAALVLLLVAVYRALCGADFETVSPGDRLRGQGALGKGVR